MKKVIVLLPLIAFAHGTLMAQDIEGFRKERERMIADYNGFRNDIISNYAHFLGEAWEKYKAFKGEKRFPDKKPSTPQKAPDGKEGQHSVPKDITPQVTIPMPPEPDRSPIGKGVPTAIDPMAEKIAFPFYGIRMKATKIKVRPLASAREKDISECWTYMQDDRVYDKVAPSLKLFIRGAELSDWLVFVLVRHYADAICPNDPNTAITLSHYILANMGFDIRLGRTGNDLVLLVPFEQMLYSRSYLEIDGRKYFVFFNDTTTTGLEIGGISTCAIPRGTKLGKTINLTLIAPYMDTGKSRPFELTANGITVSGSIDEMAKNISKEFPQTDIPVYAASCLDSKFRKQLVEQIKEQVGGMSQKDAANAILRFIQLAFKYKTDVEQFGYEKAFFVEENFIYPANDCEDRAILFAFLVRNILHLDVHLLYYPGHEATAVAFTDAGINGDGYMYEGKRFTICDPTYIMASVGQCMPQYMDVKPKVQLW